jgi:hypothetical protein
MLTWHQVSPSGRYLNRRPDGTASMVPPRRLTLLREETATTFPRVIPPRGRHEASPGVEIPDGAHI